MYITSLPAASGYNLVIICDDTKIYADKIISNKSLVPLALIMLKAVLRKIIQRPIGNKFSS